MTDAELDAHSRTLKSLRDRAENLWTESNAPMVTLSMEILSLAMGLIVGVIEANAEIRALREELREERPGSGRITH